MAISVGFTFTSSLIFQDRWLNHQFSFSNGLKIDWFREDFLFSHQTNLKFHVDFSWYNHQPAELSSLYLQPPDFLLKSPRTCNWELNTKPPWLSSTIWVPRMVVVQSWMLFARNSVQAWREHHWVILLLRQDRMIGRVWDSEGIHEVRSHWGIYASLLFTRWKFLWLKHHPF